MCAGPRSSGPKTRLYGWTPTLAAITLASVWTCHRFRRGRCPSASRAAAISRSDRPSARSSRARAAIAESVSIALNFPPQSTTHRVGTLLFRSVLTPHCDSSARR